MDGDNDSRVDDGRPTLGTEQCVPNQEASTLKKLFQRIAELGRRDMAGCPHAYLSFALRTNDLQPHPRLDAGNWAYLLEQLSIGLTQVVWGRCGSQVRSHWSDAQYP